MTNQFNRHIVLDVARFVAILFVMLFHYYSCWAYRGDATYPYGALYDYFSWGHLGVEFFFILTGFFIIPSLQRSDSFAIFLKKKFVRLGIPLVLCSIITFVIFKVFDNDGFIPSSSQFRNFLVSCQLVSPNVFNLLFNTDLQYINHSYWFLWVELQFLILVSVVYFVDKSHFLRNISVVSFVFCTIWYVSRRLIENYFLTNKLGIPFSEESMLYAKDWLWTFNLPMYMFYMEFGMICSFIHKRDFKSCLWLIPLIGVSLINNSLFTYSVEHVICWGIVGVWLLYVLIGLRTELFGGGALFFAKIGEASYAAYLLHEYIGILIIHKYAYLFEKQMWVLPVILILIMFTASYCGYKYIEKPLTKILLSK